MCKNVIVALQQEAKAGGVKSCRPSWQDELCYYAALIKVYFSLFAHNDSKEACLAAAMSLVVKSKKKKTKNNGVEPTVHRPLALCLYKEKWFWSLGRKMLVNLGWI